MSLSKVRTVYQHLLNKHLTLFNAIQTGALMGTGDLLSQTIIERKSWENLDFTRTARFFGLGVCLVGPTISTWYKYLDKRFVTQGSQHVNRKQILFKKVALDQFLFAPSFIVVFLSTINAVEGKNLHEIKLEINDKYSDILVANYKLWPWVQLVNFYFVPLKHQVLVVQIVALIWNTYISWKTHDPLSKNINDIPV